jgi:hypothetical protein
MGLLLKGSECGCGTFNFELRGAYALLRPSQSLAYLSKGPALLILKPQNLILLAR